MSIANSAKLAAALGASALLALLSLPGCNEARLDLSATGGTSAVEPALGVALACRARVDCTYDTVPAIETEAQCACALCAADAGAIARSVHDARVKEFHDKCGEWARTHACAPGFCPSPRKLACVDGQCTLGG